MGKAWKPPESTREFRFYISAHAIERFRERVEAEFRARTDRDLAFLLDERLMDAFSAKRVVDVIDSEMPHADTKVAIIESRAGARFHVVLRPYRANAYPPMRVVGGPSGGALAAITVMTDEMGTQNYASGRWVAPQKPGAGGLEHSPFRGTLELVKPAEAKPTPPQVAEVKSEPAAPPKHATASLAVRIKFAESVLRERPNINWSGKDGLSQLVEAKFGVGMSHATFTTIKAAMQAETAPPVAVAAAPVSAPAPRVEQTVVEQLNIAIVAERKAKERKVAAERELEAALSVLDGATAQVEKLMVQLQEQRS